MIFALPQQFGQRLAQRKNALRVGPHRVVAIHQLPYRTRWSYRAASASARDAATAWYSRLAITATKLPSRTTFITPGIFSTWLLSSELSTAPGLGGRSTRPCTMFGSRRSCTYAAPPLTLA